MADLKDIVERKVGKTVSRGELPEEWRKAFKVEKGWVSRWQAQGVAGAGSAALF